MNSLKILVAEDNKISQEMITLIMKPLGLECIVVENGEEAIEALQEQPFDILILDQHMPVMTGYEALKNIRSSDADFSAIPVIIVTGDELSGDEKKYFDAGANACLSKPIKAAALAEVIQQVLK